MSIEDDYDEVIARVIAARARIDQNTAAALDILDGLAGHLDGTETTTAIAMLSDALNRMSLERSEFALIAANYAIKARRADQLVDPDPDGRYAAYDALRGRLSGLGTALEDTQWWQLGRRGCVLEQLARLAATTLKQTRADLEDKAGR